MPINMPMMFRYTCRRVPINDRLTAIARKKGLVKVKPASFNIEVRDSILPFIEMIDETTEKCRQGL